MTGTKLSFLLSLSNKSWGLGGSPNQLIKGWAPFPSAPSQARMKQGLGLVGPWSLGHMPLLARRQGAGGALGPGPGARAQTGAGLQTGARQAGAPRASGFARVSPGFLWDALRGLKESSPGFVDAHAAAPPNGRPWGVPKPASKMVVVV